MCTSVVRGRDEKALRRCQVEVDLILDEVESNSVQGTCRFYPVYILFPLELMVDSLWNNR
jgi:hypothetical protein